MKRIISALIECDIAGDTIDLYSENLMNGLTEEENLEVCLENAGVSREPSDFFDEDIVLFWTGFAFAQWQHKDLRPNVLSAIKNIRKQIEGMQEYEFINQIIDVIMTEPSPHKRIRKKQLYMTQWQLGDVYEYIIKGNTVESSEYTGLHMYFTMIDKMRVHPGHIIPVVYMKASIKALDLAQIESLCYLKSMRKRFENSDEYLSLRNEVMNNTMGDTNNIKCQLPFDENGWLYLFQAGIYIESVRTELETFRYVGKFEKVIPPDKEYKVMDVHKKLYNCKPPLWERMLANTIAFNEAHA